MGAWLRTIVFIHPLSWASSHLRRKTFHGKEILKQKWSCLVGKDVMLSFMLQKEMNQRVPAHLHHIYNKSSSRWGNDKCSSEDTLCTHDVFWCQEDKNNKRKRQAQVWNNVHLRGWSPAVTWKMICIRLKRANVCVFGYDGWEKEKIKREYWHFEDMG